MDWGIVGKESRACLSSRKKAFALKRLSLTGLTGCVALGKHANLSEPLLHLQNQAKQMQPCGRPCISSKCGVGLALWLLS